MDITIDNSQKRTHTIVRKTSEIAGGPGDGWLCTITVSQDGYREPGADVTQWDPTSISVHVSVSELDPCLVEELGAVIDTLQEAQSVVSSWEAESEETHD